MNIEVVKTILRQILLSLGTVAVTKGYIDQSLVEPIIGGALALVAVVWGVFAKAKDQKALSDK